MSEKRTLPLLPLRGLVVHPHMMVNLDVGRARSVAAIESAIAGDSRILVVSQRDPELDDPTAGDLYTVGAVAEIRQFLRMPEGVLRILVDGQKRAEILAVREGDTYAEADVHEIDEAEDEPQTKGYRGARSRRYNEIRGVGQTLAQDSTRGTCLHLHHGGYGTACRHHRESSESET